jgi:PAS domain-containing protein
MHHAHADLTRLKAYDARLDMVEHARKSNTSSFSEFFMHCPAPGWIKRTDGTMVLSNHAYERAYGITPEDFVERTDGAHWSRAEAAQFGKLDQEAADTNALALGIEPIENPSTGKTEDLFVAKWPVNWTPDGTVTEVAGMVLATMVSGGAADDRAR